MEFPSWRLITGCDEAESLTYQSKTPATTARHPAPRNFGGHEPSSPPAAGLANPTRVTTHPLWSRGASWQASSSVVWRSRAQREEIALLAVADPSTGRVQSYSTGIRGRKPHPRNGPASALRLLCCYRPRLSLKSDAQCEHPLNDSGPTACDTKPPTSAEPACWKTSASVSPWLRWPPPSSSASASGTTTSPARSSFSPPRSSRGIAASARRSSARSSARLRIGPLVTALDANATLINLPVRDRVDRRSSRWWCRGCAATSIDRASGC